MKTRILSAVVLLPLLIFVLIKGGVYLSLFILVCSLIGVNEFVNALGKNSSQFTKCILFIATIINTLIIYTKNEKLILPLIVLLLFVEATFVVFGKISAIDAAISIFVFIYVSVSLSIVYLLSSNYNIFFPYIFIIAMVTDTFAYFSGIFFGKHKLSSISPKKTVEGAVGGILFCTFASFMYAYFFQKDFLSFVIPFAVIGSIISQIGDIFSSAFKRAMNIKDYGNIIPGHGGILDRADSIIFTTYYIYSIVNLMY